MNPQFHVEVVGPDESDTDGNGTLVVGLMQKGLREKHIEPHVIGYSVFRVRIYPITAVRVMFQN